jgi:hypothetical protein
MSTVSNRFEKYHNILISKVRAIQKSSEYLRFENHVIFVDRKKIFFSDPGFSVFPDFPQKTGFLDFFRVRKVLI